MKITSFNTLYCGYSSNTTSIHDQMKLIKQHIEQEQPVVCVLLEAPQLLQPVTGENVELMNSLQQCEAWLYQQGYFHQRKTLKATDRLSVWVVSRRPLIPLLLLGSNEVGGAMANVISVSRDEPIAKVSEASDFVDCAAATASVDRSIICGVLCDAYEAPGGSGTQMLRPVLPLVALHAPCLFYNTRFSSHKQKDPSAIRSLQVDEITTTTTTSSEARVPSL